MSIVIGVDVADTGLNWAEENWQTSQYSSSFALVIFVQIKEDFEDDT